MIGESVKYLGRMVPKDGFRVFVYAVDGAKKLMNSYEEFERHLETGLWFSVRPEKEPQEAEVREFRKPKK